MDIKEAPEEYKKQHACVQKLEDLISDLIGGGPAAELVMDGIDWKAFRAGALEILDDHADGKCIKTEEDAAAVELIKAKISDENYGKKFCKAIDEHENEVSKQENERFQAELEEESA